MSTPRQNATAEKEATDAFPPLDTTEHPPTSPTTNSTGGVIGRLRLGAEWLLDQEIPRGASQGLAQTVAAAPTLTEVRQGALTTVGEERYLQFENEDTPTDLQRRRRESSWGSRRNSKALSSPRSPVAVTSAIDESNAIPNTQSAPTASSIPLASPTEPMIASSSELIKPAPLIRQDTVYSLHKTPSGTFPNGYKFPPKHTWKESISLGTKATIRFTFGSIFGFLLVIYALNVVAWGGMIFLLLCGAGDKYMCTGYYATHCNDKGAMKSVWIEIDAQVLTALFCVTAFGLLPWRSRDLYYLMQFRLQHKHIALRKLAAAHKGWFRLPGSQHLDPILKVPDPPNPEAEQYLPYPLEKGAEAPVTGIRGLDTTLWKMDFVVWMMMANSIIQIPLCGCMWALNRYNRPSWTTALLIVLGMLSAMIAGILQLVEGKKIKAREGIPLTKNEVGNDMDPEKGFEMQSTSLSQDSHRVAVESKENGVPDTVVNGKQTS